MKLILVAAKNSDTFHKIKSSLDAEYSIDFIENKDNVLNNFSKKKYDYLLIDLDFISEINETNNYQKFLSRFWKVLPDTDIIVMAENANVRKAVDVVRAGASDYLTLPIISNELKLVLNRIQEKNNILSELTYLRSRVNESDLPLSLNTNSPLIKDVFSNVRLVADTDSTVLLTGETGTGKGLIARLIHQESKRRDHQFISMHCGAIPDSLLESELFGHEKGAFTGAIRRKLGKFEIADKGTIFLDEIGTISTAMQIKLLQVLQDKIFYRVGGEEQIKSNVRIIAATNADLAQLSHEEKFRLDLYYRLNVFQIEMPPLRDRLEDIPILVEQILKKLKRFLGKEIQSVHEEVMKAFSEYDWPGNIRELENLMERAYILETSTILTPKSFPIKLFREKYQNLIKTIDMNKPLSEIRDAEIKKVEKEYLTFLLQKNNGKIKESAQQAGIGERQLNNLMHEYNLRKEDFKRI